ncbi:putative UDP-glucuronosyl/UDP-glucosyltransferase, UDP-glycosyltransferase family [Helianthus annuus]|nr:putative UDP-glucuronosyl/UDP-glucosyltransferase, UDP-glycosyltransferase family [Helianthus annuus]
MGSEESSEHNQLHFLVVPIGSPGHYIPIIDIAKLLAQHGVRVTIISTPVNSQRYGSVLDQAIQSGLPIRFIEFPFPYAEFGLPEGCESVDDLPNYSLIPALTNAYNSLQQEVEHYIEKLDRTPNCIVADSFILWPGDTAKKFQIPRVIFDSMNCFTQMCNHVLYQSKVYENVGEEDSFVVPGLPDRFELKRSQLPSTLNPNLKYTNDYYEKLRVSESEAYGVVVNSFEELEQAYVDEFKKLRGGKVWCIGPLSLCHNDESEKVQRGNKSSISKHECLEWLDSQETGSVIYVCLGSISRVEPEQLIELALGLESSNKPFIWVIRAGPNTKKVEQWIDEQGYAERTKDRALLIHGWAPQLLVLSHPAIGGFLTHSGWNSAFEGVAVGVPLITLPLFQEQFYNEKQIVQVLRIGVSVRDQKVGEHKSGMAIKSDDVKKAIEMVIEGGEEIRKRAKELGKMARNAVEEGGSSYRNMTRLIEDIKNYART